MAAWRSGLADKCVREHFFNHAVQLVLPRPARPGGGGAERLLPDGALGQGSYWRVSGPFAALLEHGFVAEHVRLGRLSVLAATELDNGGSLAITPRGDLLIVCDQFLYQSLGLLGFPSRSDSSRRCIHVPLLDPSFAPGQRANARLMRAARLLGDLVLLLTWEADDENADPNFPAEMKVVKCHLNTTQRTYQDIYIPRVNSFMPATSGFHDNDSIWPDCDVHDLLMEAEEEPANFIGILQDDPEHKDDRWGAGVRQEAALSEFHEWIGLLAIEAGNELEALPLAAQTVYGTTLENLRFDQITGAVELYSWSGMISIEQVQRSVARAESLLQERAVPWAALTVWGFSDAPVSWGNTEHNDDYTCPENNYTLLLMPHSHRIVFYMLGARGRVHLRGHF